MEPELFTVRIASKQVKVNLSNLNQQIFNLKHWPSSERIFNDLYQEGEKLLNLAGYNYWFKGEKVLEIYHPETDEFLAGIHERQRLSFKEMQFKIQDKTQNFYLHYSLVKQRHFLGFKPLKHREYNQDPRIISEHIFSSPDLA